MKMIDVLKERFFFLLCLGVVLFSLLLDQMSKWFVLKHFFGKDFVKASVSSFPSFPHMLWYRMTSFFNVSYVWNHGVSFGLLQSSSMTGRFFLVVLATVIVVFLLTWLRSQQTIGAGIAISCVMGGALGNIFDRIRVGAVFDFLDFHIAGYHWPSFNIADTFITLGVLYLIVGMIFSKDNEAKNIK